MQQLDLFVTGKVVAESKAAADLTGSVISDLYKAHSALGTGFIHRIYANAVYRELQPRRLAVVARRQVQVMCCEEPVGQIKQHHIEVEGSLIVFPMTVQ